MLRVYCYTELSTILFKKVFSIVHLAQYSYPNFFFQTGCPCSAAWWQRLHPAGMSLPRPVLHHLPVVPAIPEGQLWPQAWTSGPMYVGMMIKGVLKSILLPNPLSGRAIYFFPCCDVCSPKFVLCVTAKIKGTEPYQLMNKY